MKNNISISLDKNESLVLFEFLSRIDSSIQSIIEHPSEEIVLDKIHANLEKNLTEIFDRDYKNIINDAREKIMGHK